MAQIPYNLKGVFLKERRGSFETTQHFMHWVFSAPSIRPLLYSSSLPILLDPGRLQAIIYLCTANDRQIYNEKFMRRKPDQFVRFGDIIIQKWVNRRKKRNDAIIWQGQTMIASHAFFVSRSPPSSACTVKYGDNNMIMMLGSSEVHGLNRIGIDTVSRRSLWKTLDDKYLHSTTTFPWSVNLASSPFHLPTFLYSIRL